MSWSVFDKQQILESYWGCRGGFCPSDGARLEIDHVPTSSKGYVLTVRCTGCDQSTQISSEEDPQRLSFRDWTREEIDRLRAIVAGGQCPTCPVCMAEVFRGIPSPPRNQVSLTCPRCGNHTLIEASLRLGSHSEPK